MTHLAYTQTGRKFTLPTGQRVYKGGVGQENVLLGDGSYDAFEWRAAENRVRFADMELRFLADEIQVWRLGVQIISFDLGLDEIGAGNKWRRLTTSRSNVRVTPVASDGPTEKLEIEYDLGHGNADATVKFVVGGSHKVRMGTEVRASVGGRYRMAFDTDYSGALTLIPARDRDPETGQPVPGATHRVLLVDAGVAGLGVGWHKRERPDHELKIDRGNHGIGIGAADLAPGQSKKVEPLTYGPQAIVNNLDDGDERFDTTWDNQGFWDNGWLYIDNNADVDRIGVRFRQVDLDGTPFSIDAGTELGNQSHDPDSNLGGGSEIDMEVGAHDIANANAWSSSNRPSQRTLTTARTTQTWDAIADINPLVIDIQAIVQELSDSDYGYFGSGTDNMAFIISHVAIRSNGFAGATGDLGENDPTRLTIVYTATAPAARGPTPTIVGRAPMRASLF